jgi:Xaa-Pro dipeptidase
MNAVARDRLALHLRSQGLEAALLSNPATIAWLTGYAPPIQSGPSPFEAGTALGWWEDNQLTLVVSNLESGAAKASKVRVIEYVGYTIDEPLAPTQNQAHGLADLLKNRSTFHGKVGVELASLSAEQLTRVGDLLPRAALYSLDGSLDRLRALKSPNEIDKIRAVVRLCDQAQVYMRDHLHEGKSEIELWGELKGYLEVEIGARLAVLVDLVAGMRTAEIGGPPGGYRFRQGDPVMLDFVPRLDGYWGDNTDTRFVGRPKPELEKVRVAVREVLRRGVAAVRPGLAARDLDRLMRTAIADAGYPVYPHHSGHGVGVTYHEEPRIVPYNELALEAGMVIALEPGIYLPDVGGVRLEDVVLVTADGCEVLTRHLTSD